MERPRSLPKLPPAPQLRSKHLTKNLRSSSMRLPLAGRVKSSSPVCLQWSRMEMEKLPMAITVCPVTASFAAEIGGVDLSGALEPADLAAIKDAFTRYAVLIFPDQRLSQDQHLDFAKTRSEERRVGKEC